MKGDSKMKLKKLLLGAVTITAIFFMTACGSDSREAFVNNLYDQKEYNASETTMKINELSFEGGEDAATYNLFANQLKDLSIEINTVVDQKKALTQSDATIKLLGQKNPFKMIGDSKNAYISTDFVSGLLNVTNAFSYDTPTVDKKKLDKLKGKYLDLTEFGVQNTALNESDLIPPNEPKNDLKAMNDLPYQKLTAELKKTVESFDKDSFKKEKDVITHTFTNAEIIKLLETYDKVLKEDKNYKKEYKDSEQDKLLAEIIKVFKDKSLNMKLKVSVNEKSNQQNVELNATMNKDDQSFKFVMDINSKLKNKKADIQLPDKKEIITSEEFQEIYSSVMPNYSNFDQTDDDEEYMNEFLDGVIDEINANKGNITEEDAKTLREELGEYFNDEQMKRLNDALDKAMQKDA
jgi:uncharacterized protein YggL (DUF469 family)